MKKTFLLLLILTNLTCACKKDRDGIEKDQLIITEKVIYGNWKQDPIITTSLLYKGKLVRKEAVNSGYNNFYFMFKKPSLFDMGSDTTLFSTMTNFSVVKEHNEYIILLVPNQNYHDDNPRYHIKKFENDTMILAKEFHVDYELFGADSVAHVQVYTREK